MGRPRVQEAAAASLPFLIHLGGATASVSVPGDQAFGYAISGKAVGPSTMA